MNERVFQHLAKNPMMLSRLRSCAFSEEYDPYDRFAASPIHTYYVVYCGGEPECILKVKFTDLPWHGNGLLRKADLSFGRVTNTPACQGWQYLKAFGEQVMVSQGPFLVVARLKNKGSRKAFKDFEQSLRNSNTAYKVLIAGEVPCSVTGYISNDQDTLESIRSMVNT
jgi:hypothetical protein